MKKKILLISSNSSSRGGGERYLVYLTQGLKQLDCEVHVLLSQQSYMNDWANFLKAEKAIVHRLPLVGLRHRPLRFIQSLSDRKQQKKIASFCRKINPDAILVNQQYDEDGLDYLSGALKANIATVGGIIHMPMTANKNSRPLGFLRGSLLQKWYQSHPYKILFVSEGCQREFEQYYQIPYQTNVVNLGCDFNSNELTKNNVDQDSEAKIPVIGFIGQFVKQKQLDLLVDAWLWLKNQSIQTKLILVGDGEERPKLEAKLTANASLEDWQIAGWQTNPAQYLDLIDIYAMSSNFEGLPLALVEAVGHGIPAVIRNFNGSSDVARQASWVRVVSSDKSAIFGRALQKTVMNLSTLKQQATLEKNKFCQYFSTKRMAEDTLLTLDIAI